MNYRTPFEKIILSVIIPVYNVKKYLYRCVDSIYSQINKNIEIILVDDGSNDGSGQLCDEIFARSGCSIKVIHKRNEGLSSARNVGINAASGKYLFFLDSDDCVEKNFIKNIFPELEKDCFDIIEFGCCVERKYNNFIPHHSNRRFEKSSKECIENILKNKTGNYICLKIYRRELFKEITFPEGRNYEDISIYYKLVMLSKRILIIDKELYIYNLTNENSITKNSCIKNMTDMYIAVNELCEGVREFCIQYDIDTDYIEYYRRQSYIYIYLKLQSENLKFSSLKKCLEKYLSSHNKYNIFKFRHYDLKRWGYYQVMHFIGKM